MVMILATTSADGQDAGEVGWVHSARASSRDFRSVFRDQTPKGTWGVLRGLELVPRTNRGLSALFL